MMPNIHKHPIRVYYEDTDFTGVVYHGSYVRFFERGRTEYIRACGVEHTELLAGAYGVPAYFVVREMNIKFLHAARIDDCVEVVTQAQKIEGARLLLEQTIMRDSKTICRADVVIVYIQADTHKPLRFPHQLRQMLLAQSPN